MVITKMDCPYIDRKCGEHAQCIRCINTGDIIEIINMQGEPQYTGRVGEVIGIDDAGQIHGTWGGCALIEGDEYRVIKEAEEC